MSRRAHCNKSTPLNQLRVAKNLSIINIAKVLGLPSGRVYAWFSGQSNPPEEHIVDIATLLGVDKEEVVRRLPHRDRHAKAIQHSAYTYKDNFWSNRRVEKGYTLRDIKTAFDNKIPLGTIGAYFCGKSMPNDEFIKAVCELLDVDFMIGKGKFSEAHRKYRATHSRELVATDRKPRKYPGDNLKFDYPLNEISEYVFEDDPLYDANKIAVVSRIIYSRVGYPEYVQIIRMMKESLHPGEIFNAIYGKIDFDVFSELARVLKV
jgi:transcriptional regulator with XRE-family HTH domain